MSQSPLVTKWWPASSTNYTAGRQGSKLFGIVIHHAASTSLDSVGYTFQNPNRQASAHYGVKGKQIHQYVGEENGAWHCGDYWANMGTIGIETVNSTGAPNWLIDEETFETLVKLVADIAKRNGFGKLKFGPNDVCPNLSAHRDWSATSCPGDYLYSRMNELAKRANEINYPSAPTISWARMGTPRVMVALAGSQLVEIKTGKVVKTYSEDTEIDMWDRGTYNGKTYMRSKYSYEKGIENGIIASMVINKPEPAPEPEPTPAPKIEWKDLDKHLGLFTNSSARLIDLDTGEVKQTYTANTKINVVQTTEYDGKVWYRTEYSATKGFNWAFESTMFVWDTPAQPEPSAPSSPPNNNSSDEGDSSPSPSPNPESPSGENTNSSKTDDSQDGSSLSDKNFVLLVLAKIMEFIKKIINLITKKGE